MTRLVPSEHALRVLVALGQRPGGLGLRQMARTLDVPVAAVQRALEMLISDGLVLHSGGREPFTLASGPAASAAKTLAVTTLEPRDAVRCALRASLVPRFAGEDRDGFMYVARDLASPEDEVRLSSALAAASAEHPEVSTVRVSQAEAASAQGRASKMRPLVGNAEILAERLPAKHGRPLGKLHPAMGRIPRRGLEAIAERLGINRIIAFGSAVRSDFRPSSDLDLLVGAEPALDLDRRIEATAAFEELFGRKVDVVPIERALDAVSESAARDGVVLLG